MTAAQLIAQLRQCDPDSPVYVTIDDEQRELESLEDCISFIDLRAEELK